MSITTQGFGGAPISTFGWGYLGSAEPVDKVEFDAFITRRLLRDVRILRKKEVVEYLTNLLKRDANIVRKIEEDLWRTEGIDRDVER